MKKLHVESDMVFQSDLGSLRMISSDADLKLHFDDWNAVSSIFTFFRSTNSDLLRLIKLTEKLGQSVTIQIGEKTALMLEGGRVKKWRLFPLLRLFRLWRKQA